MPSANPAQIPLRLALITRDPAMRRWLAAGSAATDIEIIELKPADWDIAAAVKADMVLVVVDSGSKADLDLIARLSKAGARPVALATGGSVSLAVDAMRNGAADFILQPARAEHLFERLAGLGARDPIAAHEYDPAHPVIVPANNTAPAETAFIGDAPAMRMLHKQIARIAPSAAPVFISGESGTGKELCASAVHCQSGRKPERFIAINCAAIPRDLMESELFGHVRGAFTGANEDRAGAVQLADGGTLFLDEICEMDLSLQAKLLRAIQTGSVRRVGAGADEHVDVRIVCATNRDPQVEMQAGRFRADLFYRLHVLPVHLPPLRERGDDIILLANAFLRRFSAEEGRQFCGLDPQAAAFLRGYEWPGNVRQLENLIRRIVVMHDGAMVTRDMIPLALVHSGEHVDMGLPKGNLGLQAQGSIVAFAARTSPQHAPSHGIEPFWIQEKRIIENALDLFDGHVGKAAAALEISASTIYRKKLGWDGATALSA